MTEIDEKIIYLKLICNFSLMVTGNDFTQSSDLLIREADTKCLFYNESTKKIKSLQLFIGNKHKRNDLIIINRYFKNMLITLKFFYENNIKYQFSAPSDSINFCHLNVGEAKKLKTNFDIILNCYSKLLNKKPEFLINDFTFGINK